MPKLLITLPAVGDVVHELTGDNIVVGRTSDNTIQIDEPSISLHHARFTLQPRGYRLKDLGSTNQTWINGFAVTEVELTARCLIRFGSIECVYLPEAKGGVWEAAGMRKQLTEAQTEIELRQREANALRKEVDLFTAELARLKNESALAAAEKEKLQSQNAALVDELARARHQIETLAQQQKNTQQELDTVRTQLKSAAAERDAARTENQNVRPLFEEQKRENKEITAQRDAAQKEAESRGAAHATLVTQFKKLHAENEATLENLNATKRLLETAEAQTHGLANELQTLKTAHEQSQQQTADLRAAMERSERELEASRARADEVQRALTEVHEKNDVIQNTLQMREGEAQAAASARVQLDMANRELSGENARLRSDYEGLNSRWNALVSEIQRVKVAASQVDRLIGQAPASAIEVQQPPCDAPVHEGEKGEKPHNGHPHNGEAPTAAPHERLGLVDLPGTSEGHFMTALQSMRQASERLRGNPHDRGALHEFFGSTRSLAQHSDAMSGFTAVRCMASTLEALLGDFCKLPEQLDAARVRTLSRAVDTLRLLVERDQFSAARDSFRAKICIISDDAEEPMIAATRLIDLDLSTVNYPTARFNAIADQECELVVLDLGSRGPGWLEFCSRVRAFPRHKRTAIIVVTTGESSDSTVPLFPGGNEDFISKPFNTFEMAVKMLTGIFKRRLETAPAVF